VLASAWRDYEAALLDVEVEVTCAARAERSRRVSTRRAGSLVLVLLALLVSAGTLAARPLSTHAHTPHITCAES